MSDLDIAPVGAVDVGLVASVALFPSDRGLDLVFHPESGQSIRVGMDWLDVADLMLRVAEFGQRVSTMMQIGLDPYNAQHRGSAFDAADDVRQVHAVAHRHAKAQLCRVLG